MMILQIATKKGACNPQVMMEHEFLFQSQASNAMLEWGSCKQITGRRKQESLLQSQASNCNAWMEVLWANNVWKVAACGGSQPYVLLFIQHMEESSQPLHTSSTKYTYIYIYIYKFWACLISLFSSTQRKKQTYKQKVLGEKEQWNNKPPSPFH
jgi:hypothetical protein